MDVELYCCYSLPLRNFLYINGLRYKLAALNPNNKKLFWVYTKNEKLDELLDRWSANKQIAFSNGEIYYVKILEVAIWKKRKYVVFIVLKI